MPMRRGQRRVLRVIGLLCAAMLLAIVATPLWFPLVLGPLARHQGMRYAGYRRAGYGQLLLQEVTYTNASMRFQAAQLQAVTPTLWLWRCLVEGQHGRLPLLQITDWRLETVPSAKPSSSPFTEAQEWSKNLAKLGYWLPMAVLRDGTIRSGTARVGVPEASWTGGTLQARLTLPAQHEQARLKAELVKTNAWTAQITSETLHLDAALRCALTADKLDLHGTFLWWSNRVETAAQFGPGDRWPARASLKAPQLRIPAAVLPMEGYRDLSGSCSADWDRGSFALDLEARALPLPGQPRLPPVGLDLHAHGDTNAAVVDSARVSAPWLHAELPHELAVHFTGPLLREPARLKLEADLGKQPWLPLEGTLAGQADLSPTGAKLPHIRWHLSGRDVGTAAVKARTLQLEGELDWPWLVVQQARARFDDGSEASAQGRMQMVQEDVADGHFNISGPLAARWLPPGYSYQALSVAGNVHGPLQALVHDGTLHVKEFTSPGLQPLDLRAAWAGHQQELTQLEIVAQAAQARLQARGAVRLGTSQVSLELTNLTLLDSAEPVLELERPCRMTLTRAAPGGAWRATATPFDWAGKGGQVHAGGTVCWPSEGALWALVRNVPGATFAGFTTHPLPPFELGELQASAGWTNGPARLALALSASGQFGQPGGTNLVFPFGFTNAVPVSVEMSLAGDAAGIRLSNLVVNSQGSTLTSAQGFLPLTLTPGARSNVVRFESSEPLRLEAVASSKAVFWDALAARTGVELSAPELKVNLLGTWTAPLGQVELRAREIRFQNGPPHLPVLRDLELNLRLDRHEVHLEEARVFAQGQPVLVTADLPLGEGFWAALRAGKVEAWAKGEARAGTSGHLEQVTGHLLIENAELAAFADLFPQLLTPQGRLTVDVSLERGLKVTGGLRVSQARTRPLGNLGPIRDIEVQMRFRGRTLELEHASAGVGGATLTVTGQTQLEGTAWMHGELPPFHFAVQGTNVPLSRGVSSIIRSDLDLALTKTNRAPPLISGGARLRDSIYLSDLNLLVPGKVATPRRRPPYFSVEDPMLEDWRLNVHVTGPHFLKVLTPLFNGEVSADLRLQGTLKDPLALGDLKVDSGVVRFPFASFQVRQGLVTLTSENPYQPQLLVSADSRQYGYDLRMEVSGPADEPVLQFTSTPPLASEQVLLMVTAGELPHGEFALTPQQKAQTVAMFLGRDLLSKLGFGDQAEQRLTFQSGQDITEQGQPTYNVEYKLSKRWSVEGEYDRFGDFNAGFKWRIYSK